MTQYGKQKYFEWRSSLPERNKLTRQKHWEQFLSVLDQVSNSIYKLNFVALNSIQRTPTMANMQMDSLSKKANQLSTMLKQQREWESRRRWLCTSTLLILLVSNIRTNSSCIPLFLIFTSSSQIWELDSLDLCNSERQTWMPSRKAITRLLSTIYHKCPKSETWELYLWVDSCLFMELWLEPPMLSQNWSWVISSAWNVTNMFRTLSSNLSTPNQWDAPTKVATTRLDGSLSPRTQLWLIGKRWECRSTQVIFQLALCQDLSMSSLEARSLIWPSQETRLYSLVS